MVSSNGVYYDGDNYVKVVANVVTQNEDVTSEGGGKTFSMKAVGEYLISYDCQKVLIKKMDDNTYSELENRISEYESQSKQAN